MICYAGSLTIPYDVFQPISDIKDIEADNPQFSLLFNMYPLMGAGPLIHLIFAYNERVNGYCTNIDKP
jgi:hypothetical protein